MTAIDKGPAEVMRALASGDPQSVQDALEFQRESFREEMAPGIVVAVRFTTDTQEEESA